MVRDISFIDFCKRNGEVSHIGARVALRFKRKDARLNNIPKRLKFVERLLNLNYKNSCGCHIIYDVEKDRFEISNKLIFIDSDGDIFRFGKLTLDEIEAIEKKLRKRKYFKRRISYGKLLNTFNEDEFFEEYNDYF